MNNKGQSLVAFIIVLPLILFILGVVIELGYIGYEKNRIMSVTKSIIANAIEEDKKNDIIILYDKNDIKVDDLKVNFDKGVLITGKVKVTGILGKEHEININILGYKKNNKMYYEKG